MADLQHLYTEFDLNFDTSTSDVWPVWNLEDVVIQVHSVDGSDFSTAVLEVESANDPNGVFVSSQPSLILNTNLRMVRLGMRNEVYGPFIRVRVTTAEGSTLMGRVSMTGRVRE